METVEILIKLPKGHKELIDDIFGNNGLLPHAVSEDLLGAISLGIVLPKGHGDLIDRNEIKRKYKSDGNWNLHKAVDSMPTVIEADKEASNE